MFKLAFPHETYENIIYIESVCKFTINRFHHALVCRNEANAIVVSIIVIIIQLPTNSSTRHVIQLDVKIIFGESECRPRSNAIDVQPRV